MARKGKCFFILSCARSGSTSLARILDEAENGVCVVEPEPNLNLETREMMEGRLSDPRGFLEATVVKRVEENLSDTRIYGEKNVTYGPFVSYLYEMLNCKFIFLKRDGRDVVRSLMDWHELMFGDIYRECKDPGNLSPRAISAAAKLPVHLDTSDYSRPRPLPGTAFYDEWEGLSREEMCAYYWSYINDLYLDQLEKIPQEAWTEIDYTSTGTDDIFRVSEFLGLKGLPRDRIRRMLGKKINSLKERTGEEATYPDWKNWDGGLRRRFDRIASMTMRRLGYYRADGSDWRPRGYGSFWDQQNSDLEWYMWMYNSRREMHADFVEWVHKMEGQGEFFESIADFGCGLGVGYCDDFADKHYVGIDLSPRNIAWCQKNRKNPKHRYLNIDFISEPLNEAFDLVFSSGTIDNSYDVDQFLKAMVRTSRRWIYLTCYRGWFPDLDEHRYQWNEEHGCFYNDLCPRRLRQTLESFGCQSIVVEPMETKREDIPYETRVIAQVPSG